jgi:hypothetical protein
MLDPEAVVLGGGLGLASGPDRNRLIGVHACPHLGRCLPIVPRRPARMPA